MVRRVAVIGAGSSGLACIKVCLDEGLEPVCFESSDDIGGLWKFKAGHTTLQVKPCYLITPCMEELLDRKPLINDDLPGRILHGALVMKPKIRGFKDSGVIFEDGTVEENIDAVIFCTSNSCLLLGKGFARLPWKQKMLEAVEVERRLNIHRRVFPPSLQHPTLAIMGLFQTKGPIMPTVEMQVRWAVKVFSGFARLPSKQKMLEAIEVERRLNIHSYPNPQQAVLQVNFIQYLDFMANEIGVKPNLLRLFLTDPVLWVKVFFGPCTPYQYRLTGPGQWAGARQAILTQWERVAKPFKTRVVQEPEAQRSLLRSPWLMACAATTVMALLLSNKIVPLAQHASQVLDSSSRFLWD
ncbi:PREDICTED: dimethylaniline monooxygenase [N-oxide-forming] 2-like [Cyprinodon variegatus]|uniref:dimethylaniline monooxygenase [N-oxide-forming] 2-like n=1 Tax=Cyprinodon variegatus TaxID=28743 RepID=UPI0007428A6E|nr:PREDICTED: dimethylaniline monooxygenase [N-oxide-forming] 2-like [Cyprinodon variegatus]